MLRLSNADGRVLAERVTLASSFWARFRGLMGQRAIAQDEGLYLPGTSSIHMLFMRFPIDCLFVGPARGDGTRKVVGVRRSLAPWRGLAWGRGADGVVELAAGALDRATIAQGDTVRLEPRAAEAEAST